MNEITKLKEKNLRQEQKIGALKVIIDDFAKKFDNISSYEDTIEVCSEDENGYVYGQEQAIYGEGLNELYKLIKDFIEFASEVK